MSDTTATTPLLLDVNAAAAALGVSRSALYVLMRDGLLMSVRVGGRRYVKRGDLARFVESLPAAPLTPEDIAAAPA